MFLASPWMNPDYCLIIMQEDGAQAAPRFPLIFWSATTATTSVLFASAVACISFLARGLVWLLEMAFRFSSQVLISTCIQSAETLWHFQLIWSDSFFKQVLPYSVLSISNICVLLDKRKPLEKNSISTTTIGVEEQPSDFGCPSLKPWCDEFDFSLTSSFVGAWNAAPFSSSRDLAVHANDSKDFTFWLDQCCQTCLCVV